MSRVPRNIERRPFDLIVIGAGINGAGIAREATLRGLSVLILDKDGIGGGTTSYATRLIHGGLRYLEYYEIGLVRESLHEREALLRIAPHLVHPLAFLLPIYEGGKRGPELIRLGMMAYDVLSFDKSLPRHTMLNRAQTLAHEPALDREGLRGAALYWDAQVTFPERLTLENALDAHALGAVILPHARVDRLLLEGRRVAGVTFTDLTDGQNYTARSAITINAAGPWVDQLLAVETGLPPERLIGGTKGSHIVVKAFPGAPQEALYVEARSNGRPYFIVPWNGLYLIGTTDLRYTGDLDRIVADEDEIEYLVRETNAVIPDAGLTRESVLYSYAGVRPLPYTPEGKEGGITRRHIIRDHAPEIEGLITIIGGKLTTYRNLAEQAVDLAFRRMGRRPPPSTSARIPLPGARTADWPAFAARFRTESGLPANSADQLLQVYGTRSTAVLERAGGNDGLLAPFSPSGAIGAEVPFALDQEFAIDLVDVMLHTTMTGWAADAGIGPDERAANLAEQTAGWTLEYAEKEVNAYRTFVERYKPHALMPMGQ